MVGRVVSVQPSTANIVGLGDDDMGVGDGAVVADGAIVGLEESGSLLGTAEVQPTSSRRVARRALGDDRRIDRARSILVGI